MYPHCKACDDLLHDYELSWREDLGRWEELCGECLNIIFTKDLIDDIEYEREHIKPRVHEWDPIHGYAVETDMPTMQEREAVYSSGE